MTKNDFTDNDKWKKTTLRIGLILFIAGFILSTHISLWLWAMQRTDIESIIQYQFIALLLILISFISIWICRSK